MAKIRAAAHATEKAAEEPKPAPTGREEAVTKTSSPPLGKFERDNNDVHRYKAGRRASCVNASSSSPHRPPNVKCAVDTRSGGCGIPRTPLPVPSRENTTSKGNAFDILAPVAG